MKNSIYILLILGFFACKKENDKTDEKTNICDSIVIGQSQNMKIESINYIIAPKLGLAHGCLLDINNDNVYDCEILIMESNEHDSDWHIKSYLCSINSNFLINGKIIADTMFLNNKKETIKDTLKRVFIDRYFYYSCSRKSNKDSIVKINNDYLIANPFQTNSLLQKTDKFKSDTIILNCKNYTHNFGSPNVSDTTIWTTETFNIDCNQLPIDNICYIGFKILDKTSEKLGWIKLSIDKDYNISIIESAINK